MFQSLRAGAKALGFYADAINAQAIKIGDRMDQAARYLGEIHHMVDRHFHERADDRNWVTLIVRDPVTGYMMGDTLHVPPGATTQVTLAPQANFDESSVFEIETESPGIAIIDVKIAGRTILMGSLPNEPRKECSVRSGNIEGCNVGVQVQFTLCNFRQPQFTERPTK